jgi:hydrophobe/amphiphile efflux-3 (HAE3) family protein
VLTESLIAVARWTPARRGIQRYGSREPSVRGAAVHKFWSWLGLNLGKHWVLVIAVGTAVTIVLGYGMTRLEFSTGQENYLNKSDQVFKDNVVYQQIFGGEAMVTLVTMHPGHTVEELFDDSGIKQWLAVQRDIHDSHKVAGVVTPLTALQWNDRLIQSPTGDPTQSIAGKILFGAIQRTKDPKVAAKRTADGLKTVTRLSAIPVAQRRIDNPKYLNVLLYDNTGKIREPLLPFFPTAPGARPDNTHAQMVVRLLGNESIKQEGEAADVVQQAVKDNLHFANATITTTGAPKLLQNLNDYLTGGMATLALIAIGLMMVILLVLFSVRWRLLPLGIVLIGIIWAFGVAGYLGIPLTIVTIAGLPVMLGIGIDYAIQMHARVEEEVIIARADHPIQETARNLGPALLVVTFDAIFAFAALHWARVPMLRAFGLLLAVGVAMICLNSIVGTLAILGIREYKSPTKGRDFSEGPLGRLVVWLGSLSSRLGPALAIVSLVIFVGGIFAEGKLVLQTDPVQWVNQKSRVIGDLHVLDHETGSSSELGMFVVAEPTVFTDSTVHFVDDFTRAQLARYPDTLLTVSGLVPVVSQLLDVPDTPHVTPTAADVRAAYAVAPADIRQSTVSPSATAMNLVFRTGPSGLDARAAVVREVRATVRPPAGVKATPSGLAVVGVGLLDNLKKNRAVLTYLSIAFVFLFLAVRLRSVVRALLSLVPVLIAVGAASLFAWALHLKLSPMTAVGGPLVVAACTEFTSLILLRFLEERRRGLQPREAVDVTASRTGRAFIVSALTAVSGIAVIATSSLPLLRDFGEVVALNVAVALLSALVVLPPMLVWADRRNWVSRGMVPDEVLHPPQPEEAASVSV